MAEHDLASALAPRTEEARERRHYDATFALLTAASIATPLIGRLGDMFGCAVVASVLDATVRADGYPSERGFAVAFAVCAVALALGIFAGLAIPQRRPADAFASHEAGDLRDAV